MKRREFLQIFGAGVTVTASGLLLPIKKPIIFDMGANSYKGEIIVPSKRVLRAEYTLEMAHDLRAKFGSTAEDELVRMFSESILFDQRIQEVCRVEHGKFKNEITPEAKRIVMWKNNEQKF